MHLTFRLKCKVVFSFASSSPVSDHNILGKKFMHMHQYCFIQDIQCIIYTVTLLALFGEEREKGRIGLTRPRLL